MCEPTTILAVSSLVATAAGGYMTYQAQDAQAESVANTANYNAQVAANNQEIAEQKAADAVQRGDERQTAYARKVARLKGRQRAQLAANGLDLGSGTPQDVFADTDRAAQDDLETIRDNAQREAWDYRISGMNYGAESALARNRAGTAREVGRLKRTSTLLNTGSKVASRWYGYDQQGAL